MKEYSVILKPYYRTEKPYIFRVIASNKKQAEKEYWRTIGNTSYKILDIQLSKDIVWNNETVDKYWNMYKL